MKVEGACHCGRIAFEAIVDPEKVGVCHCGDCQKLSGSAYRVTVQVPRETFKLHSGEPRIYVKTAESGAKRAQAFCPDCGSPISASALSDPLTCSLRVGCLDQRADLPPRRQIWCRSALGWTKSLDNLPASERQ